MDTTNAGVQKKRQAHKKSRRGCLTCKKKHLKCDEQGPPCANCRIRNFDCVYLTAPEKKAPAKKGASTSAAAGTTTKEASRSESPHSTSSSSSDSGGSLPSSSASRSSTTKQQPWWASSSLSSNGGGRQYQQRQQVAALTPYYHHQQQFMSPFTQHSPTPPSPRSYSGFGFGGGETSFPVPDRFLELELMHRWMTRTWTVMYAFPGDEHDGLVNIPRAAVRYPFLMNSLLAASAADIAQRPAESGGSYSLNDPLSLIAGAFSGTTSSSPAAAAEARGHITSAASSPKTNGIMPAERKRYFYKALEYCNSSTAEVRARLSAGDLTPDNIKPLFDAGMMTAMVHWMLYADQTTALERVLSYFDMTWGAYHVVAQHWGWYIAEARNVAVLMRYMGSEPAIRTASLRDGDREMLEMLERVLEKGCGIEPTNPLVVHEESKRKWREENKDGIEPGPVGEWRGEVESKNGDGKESTEASPDEIGGGGGIRGEDAVPAPDIHVIRLAYLQLKLSFIMDTLGVVKGFCFSLCTAAGPEFIQLVRALDPAALLIMLYFGVSLHRLSIEDVDQERKKRNKRKGEDPMGLGEAAAAWGIPPAMTWGWWVKNTGKELVGELLDMLRYSNVARMPEGIQVMNWARAEVGLPVSPGDAGHAWGGGGMGAVVVEEEGDQQQRQQQSSSSSASPSWPWTTEATTIRTTVAGGEEKEAAASGTTRQTPPRATQTQSGATMIEMRLDLMDEVNRRAASEPTTAGPEIKVNGASINHGKDNKNNNSNIVTTSSANVNYLERPDMGTRSHSDMGGKAPTSIPTTTAVPSEFDNLLPSDLINVDDLSMTMPMSMSIDMAGCLTDVVSSADDMDMDVFNSLMAASASAAGSDQGGGGSSAGGGGMWTPEVVCHVDFGDGGHGGGAGGQGAGSGSQDWGFGA